MIRLVIIDDEPGARATLQTFLHSYCPDITIVGEADDVPSGVSLIRKTEPDIVLLDIQMGKETGFDLLDKFSSPTFRVIFTTAYNQFALKAFKYAALDYLLKPIDPNELIKAIDRAKANFTKEKTYQLQIHNLLEANHKKYFDKMALPTTEGIIFIKVSDILYLQSNINYTYIFVKGEDRITASKTLKDYEEILPENTFCRIHQSYMCNINFVKKVLKEDGGFVLLDNGQKIPVSRRKKEDLLKLLNV